MASNPNQDVIHQLTQKVNFWFKLNIACQWLHWGIGILGVTCSTLAASSVIKTAYLGVFSVSAAVCFGIIGFVNPQKQAAKYIRAFRILEPAIREYAYSDLSLNDLFALHKRAEELLNDSEQVTSGSAPPAPALPAQQPLPQPHAA